MQPQSGILLLQPFAQECQWMSIQGQAVTAVVGHDGFSFTWDVQLHIVFTNLCSVQPPFSGTFTTACHAACLRLPASDISAFADASASKACLVSGKSPKSALPQSARFELK
jgi:hypothetical protein